VKDANNYYICRANPAGEQLPRVLRQNGVRAKQLASARPTSKPAMAHYQDRHAGNDIECWFDGKKLLEASDSTFPEKGCRVLDQIRRGDLPSTT